MVGQGGATLASPRLTTDRALSTFLGNGLGLRVSSLEPFRARLDAARAPYYVHSGDSSQTRRSLYVPLATGFIVELQEEK